ncbi:helix-turn-helix domain-containing protein [Andreprevotia chitinilytica]|uniref:helix-turn-helix domain-containing protein n=1 Tax=Andreprevotia chitinilytica TaxID=396808 RepID=UPI000558A5BE|nr:helix-turn-helix transcriptional regulator [Andreprevotia chitinilytica]
MAKARIRFGISVRQRRNQLEWSQEELAERSGLHRTYIGQVERGVRNISIDNMEALAEALMLPLAELLRSDS